MTIPTLVLVGGHDDTAKADACRKMAAGEDDVGISRQKSERAPVQLIVYPDAPFAFDRQGLKTPAADQSSEALREFLQATMGSSQ